MDAQGQNGLLSTFREGWRNRSLVGIAIAVALIGFYVTLYFTEWWDPVARAMGLQNRWFLYGGLYTVAMGGGAVYYLRRHGNSRYNRYRIATNVGIQIAFGFSVPFIMFMAGQKARRTSTSRTSGP